MPSKAALAAAAAAESKKSENDSVLKKCSEQARTKVDGMFAGTAILEEATPRVAEMPRFRKSEINMGRVLGRGGFGVVNEVAKIKVVESSKNLMKEKSEEKFKQRPSYLDDEEDDFVEFEDKLFIAQHCLRKKTKDARYAIKYLSAEVKTDPNKFVQAVMDMAVETHFLSVVEHPNIIKMRAIAPGDIYDKDYFLILDRLYDTLEARIRKWDKANKKLNGSLRSIRDKKGKKKDKLLEDRLCAAYDLCSAVSFMHSKNIIYRDLKPENIGFDVRDDVKLFDFGLAKELSSKEKLDGDVYKLSGETGSMRYMAPEVHKSKPYNLTADVYSFAMLLWEILALEKPFEEYSTTLFQDRVVNKGYRPKCDPSWSSKVQEVLKSSWDADLKVRPSSAEVTEMLKMEVAKLRDGDDSGLEHSRRRSTHVFKQSK